MKRTNPEIEEKVIKSYLKGNSCNSVAAQLGINSVTVLNILKRNNITTRTKGGIYKLPVDDIIRDYRNGIRIIELAKKYNVHERTIYNYLESVGEERDYIYINKSLRRDYFSIIDSYDKAYFLGFIISDGCIQDDNNLRITLQLQDDYILKIFAKKICNENPLYFNGSRPNEITFHFKSKQVKDDLAKYGVVPRKSLISYLPIDMIPDDLIHHMIRGTFDGNGWITCTDKTKNIGYCAGNERIVTEFRDWLVFKLGVYNVKVIQFGEHQFSCEWDSIKDIIAICNYIYKDKQDCFLKRKYNKFMIISS